MSRFIFCILACEPRGKKRGSFFANRFWLGIKARGAEDYDLEALRSHSQVRIYHKKALADAGKSFKHAGKVCEYGWI